LGLTVSLQFCHFNRYYILLLQNEDTSMLMPSMFVQNEMSFITKPFSKRFTQSTTKLEAFFHDKEWQIKLPPDRFLIKGFVLGPFHDITKIQIHSLMRENITNITNDTEPDEKIKEIILLFRSYLNSEKIEVGLDNLPYWWFIFCDVLTDFSSTLSIRNLTISSFFLFSPGLLCIFEEILY
jgi:hypothetical protein